MEKILEDICALRGVTGALIVTKDGLPIDNRGNFKNEPELVGAGISEMFTAADTMTSERFQTGHPREIVVTAEKHLSFVFDVNDDMILAVVAEDSANIGLVLLECRRAVKMLAEEEL